jgi:hypothetical protein
MYSFYSHSLIFVYEEIYWSHDVSSKQLKVTVMISIVRCVVFIRVDHRYVTFYACDSLIVVVVARAAVVVLVVNIT